MDCTIHSVVDAANQLDNSENEKYADCIDEELVRFAQGRSAQLNQVPTGGQLFYKNPNDPQVQNIKKKLDVIIADPAIPPYIKQVIKNLQDSYIKGMQQASQQFQSTMQNNMRQWMPR